MSVRGTTWTAPLWPPEVLIAPAAALRLFAHLLSAQGLSDDDRTQACASTVSAHVCVQSTRAAAEVAGAGGSNFSVHLRRMRRVSKASCTQWAHSNAWATWPSPVLQAPARGQDTAIGETRRTHSLTPRAERLTALVPLHDIILVSYS